MNLAPSILEAIKGSAAISDKLGDFHNEASVHTRRPVPKTAGYPLIVISSDITHGDMDALVERRGVVVRDVIVYGRLSEDRGTDQYRVVEEVAYLVRTLFHRQRGSITPDGADVIDVVASGPRAAPTDDDKIIARVVTLTIRFSITT